MRTIVAGAVLLALGGAALAAGILPPETALALWQRVWPILLFVVAMTVVTELAAAAGAFTVVAQHAVRWGHGRGWMLWLLVVGGSALCTVFLSLDTTAVLLTPVVLGMARHARLNPLPFALTALWMANTGSLLLPVSNLTNLLAQHAMGQTSPAGFAALMWAPALVAMAVPMVALFVVSRRQLVVRYAAREAAATFDAPVFWTSAIVLVVLIPALVSGIPVWIPASAAAAILVGLFVARRPSVLRLGLVPWRLVLLAAGLFVAVESLHALGLGALLTAVSGTGEGTASLLRLSATGAVGANLVNNLPAYLALEPAAGEPVRLAALLVGVNAGPLIAPWASLATLLWRDRLSAAGIAVPWRRVVLLGAVVAPLTVLTATLALAATAG